MSRLMGLVNIIIYFIGQLVFPMLFVYLVGLFTTMKKIADYKEVPNMLILLLLFTNVLTLLIIALINKKYLKTKIKQIKKNVSNTITSGIKGYIVIVLVNIVLSIVLYLFKINAGEPKNQQTLNIVMEHSAILVSLLSIGILTPILEEIIFRMSLMGVLIKDKPSKNWLPYILAAIIFALMHEHNIIYNFSTDSLALFLSYFGSALVLSGVYKLTKHNLGSTSITHILNNSIAIILAGVVS